MNPLISVTWLKEHLNKSNLIVLDSSLDNTVSGSYSKFKDLTIPTARYFDLKTHFSNTKSPYPNTLKNIHIE
jgi:thiosulfate/3-mercaptopyruvate sulfurtransferase